MMIPITLFALTLTIVGFGAVGTAAEEEASQVQAADAGWIWLNGAGWISLDDAGWISLDEEADPAEPAPSPLALDDEQPDPVLKALVRLVVRLLGLKGVGDVRAAQSLPNNLGIGGVLTDGWVFACDTEADGWGVRTHYVTLRDGQDHVGDVNGSKNNCGKEPPLDGHPVISFRVCAGVNGADTVCR